MSDGYGNERKMSTLLLSLEEKMNNLVKTIAVQDMNNKLILDRLNKLLQNTNNNLSKINQIVPESVNNTESATVKNSLVSSKIANSLNDTLPIKDIDKINKTVTKDIFNKIEDKKQNNKNTEGLDIGSINNSKSTKIPVSQRITDQQGKDLFMADVIITDSNNEIVLKTKTTAVGKWNAYLMPGKYSVQITKIIDGNSLNKIEALQEIEVKSTIKSLQLPIAIIKR